MRDAAGAQNQTDLDPIEAERARHYGLLAVLLAKPPAADLLARLGALRGDAGTLGLAHTALGQAAAAATAAQVEREFFDLFVGIGRGELLPYGSYYLTGRLHDRPLMLLRNDLARLGIERAEGCAEPEDHAAVLCDVMAGLIEGRLAAPPGADRGFFTAHLAPWLGRFFDDLQRAKAAAFYRGVGAVGRQFMAVESEAFAFAA